MFNNTAINVAIGLIFIFLLYSLLATILQEILANWFGARKRFLVKIIRRMLESRKYGTSNAVVDYFVDIAESLRHYFNPFPDKRSFAKAFYCHPTIKQLGEGKLNSKPSYISADTFAQTIIDLLRSEDYDINENQMEQIRKTIWENSAKGFTISDDTRTTLKAIWIDALDDLSKFRANLEVWYNRLQERGTGWYKRTVQFMLFWIGMACAIGFNVDAIAIAQILMKDKTAQEKMVKLAESRYKDYGAIAAMVQANVDSPQSIVFTDTAAENLYAELKNDAEQTQAILGLGPWWVGGTDTDRVAVMEAFAKLNTQLDSLHSGGDTIPANYVLAFQAAREDIDNSVTGYKAAGQYQKDCLKMVVGWVITALAISLGAPFWFDLLNKIMVLRGTGKKPEPDKQ